MLESDRTINSVALRQLRSLVRRLGSDGGSITPSIYETAQVLRFCPHLVDADRVTGWLLRRQRSDGGWGQGSSEYRITPTLAAVLALHSRPQTAELRRAVQAGVRFLNSVQPAALGSSAYSLPIAKELIVPRLLDEAAAAGLDIARTAYASLAEFGARRRHLIARLQPGPQSPPMFSWEAWGEQPAAELVDPLGGVGHSPAATAWWLRLAAGRPELAAARRMAEDYLRRSTLATGESAFGVTSSPWPMARFEQAFVLHTLAVSGLLSARGLASVLIPQLEDLRLAIHNGGLGFSDRFAADGDDTAAGMAVLAMAGIDADLAIFSPFARPDHCVAYPFEMHASHTVTARAAHAISLFNCDAPAWRESIAAMQDADGWWHGDKWNLARTYGSWVSLLALAGHGYEQAKQRCCAAFVEQQHADGGWGAESKSTPIETAFGILALCTVAGDTGLSGEATTALQRAHHYLAAAWQRRQGLSAQVWISKELYSPRRIDRTVVLCALLAPAHVTQVAKKATFAAGRRRAGRAEPSLDGYGVD